MSGSRVLDKGEFTCIFLPPRVKSSQCSSQKVSALQGLASLLQLRALSVANKQHNASLLSGTIQREIGFQKQPLSPGCLCRSVCVWQAPSGTLFILYVGKKRGLFNRLSFLSSSKTKLIPSRLYALRPAAFRAESPQGFLCYLRGITKANRWGAESYIGERQVSHMFSRKLLK